MRKRGMSGQVFSSKNDRRSVSRRNKNLASLDSVEMLEARCVLATGTISDYLSLSYPTSPQAGASLTVSAKINGTLLTGVDRTGTITLSEGGTQLAQVTLGTDKPSATGYYALTVPAGLTIGTHSLSVAYSGDDNYAATSSNVSLNVVNDTLALKYTSQTLPGAQYSVGVAIRSTQVTGTPGGTLTLSKGTTTLATLDLSTATADANGYYSLNAGSFAAGVQSLRVTYSGDGNYTANASSLSVNVTTPLTTSISSSYTTSPIAGAAYTVSSLINGSVATGTPRTGTLSLVETIGTGATAVTNTLTSVDIATTAPNASGYYALSVAGGLSAGAHALSVVYSGDANYATSKQTLSTVTARLQTTYVSGSYGTMPIVGSNYTVNALVSGTLTTGVARTGTLSLVETVGGVATTLTSVDLTVPPPTGGYYALTVTGGLTVGAHALSVVYSGDANYATSKMTLSTVNVQKVGSSLSLSYSIPQANQSLTINAKVLGSAITGSPRTGTVTLSEGDTVLATADLASANATTGYIALNVAAGLSAGAHSLKVTYSGDSLYNTASSTVSLNLLNDSLLIKRASIALTGGAYPVGVAIKSATLTAAPGGTITITEGTTTLATLDLSTATRDSQGYYTLNPGPFAAGSHTLKVSYSGDGTYTANSSTFSVTAASPLATTVGASYGTTATAGSAYTVSAYISGVTAPDIARTGTLSLVEANGDGTTTTLASVDVGTTAAVNGYYALKVTGGLSVGSHTLQVVYSGDANYATSSRTLSPINVVNDSVSLKYTSQALIGSQYNVGVAIKSTTLTGAPTGGTITLSEGTNVLATLDLSDPLVKAGSDGYYVLSVAGFAAGSHSLKVSYSGDGTFTANSASFAITAVSPLTTSISVSQSTQVGSTSGVTVYASINGSVAPGIPRTGTLSLMEGTTVLKSIDLSTATTISATSTYYSLSLAAGVLSVGSHSLSVVYSGDDNYATSTKALSAINVVNDSLSAKYSSTATTGADYTVQVAIRGLGGLTTPLAGGSLSLVNSAGVVLATIDLSTAVADSSGYYTLKVVGGFSAAGTVSGLKIVFSGDGLYSANSTTLGSVKVTDPVIV